MLIALEGVDASGKKTQADLLYERLRADGLNARLVNFPDYGSRAAGAVRMYLDGEFGADPDDVNPYAASAFFAVDRYASWKKDWGAFLAGGGIVVSDRYTMSNMIHQGAKIADARRRREYIEWLRDLEFAKFGLPEPQLVIFLDLPMELRVRLMEERAAKEATAMDRATAINRAAAMDQAAATNRAGARDIHERNLAYLDRAHACARETAEYLGWRRVSVERGGGLRPIKDVHADVYAAVRQALGELPPV